MEANLRHWKTWAELIAKSWDDPALHRRLLEQPVDVLREIGVELPPGMSVRVVESPTAQTVGEIGDDWTLVLPLPPKPSASAGRARELSDDELARVAGGAAAQLQSALKAVEHGDYLASSIQPVRAPRAWGTGLAAP